MYLLKRKTEAERPASMFSGATIRFISRIEQTRIVTGKHAQTSGRYPIIHPSDQSQAKALKIVFNVIELH